MNIFDTLPERNRRELEKFINRNPRAGELFEELTDEQARAVSYHKGHSAIYAGPGAGKTKTMVAKILFNIGAKLADESNILAITFTRAAAREMKDRLADALGRPPLVTVGTIHSISYGFLRKTGKFPYRVADETIVSDFYLPYLKDFEGKLGSIVKTPEEYEILVRYGLAKKEEKGYSIVINKNSYESLELLRERYYNYVVMKKHGAVIPPEAVREFQFTEKLIEATKDIFKEIKENMKKEGFITFTDILVYYYNRISKDPKFRNMVASAYTNVFVDEFQDVSYIQFMGLSPFKKGRVTVVGDDDQSIYTWRSAYPYIFDEFKKAFKPKEFFLTKNFRSKQEIVECANVISSLMNKRVPKKITSVRGRGGLVETFLYPVSDRYEQTMASRIDMASRVVKRLTKHYSDSDIAILVSENRASSFMERALLNLGIPVVNLTKRSILDMKESQYVGWALSTFLYGNAYREFSLLVKEATKGVGDTALDKMLLEIDKLLAEDKKVSYKQLLEIFEEKKILRKEIDFWKNFSEELDSNRETFMEIPNFLPAKDLQESIGDIVDTIFVLYSPVFEKLAEEVAKKRVKKPKKKELEGMSDEEKERVLEEYEEQLIEKRGEFFQNLEAIKEYITQNLENELLTWGKDKLTPEEWKELWEKIRGDIILGKDSKEENIRKKGVKIMTVHQAKGLEFKCSVYLPAPFALTDEEAKRVAYVAVTRAKDVACICLSSYHLEKDLFWREVEGRIKNLQPGGMGSDRKPK